jgi:hypothetical protein
MLVDIKKHDWSTIVGYLKKMYEAYQAIDIENGSEAVKQQYLTLYNR